MKAIYLFYIFKFAPSVIDQRTHVFWRNAVNILNTERRKSNGAFYLWKFWRIYIREPYAIPITTYWTVSRFHPFCWKKYNAELTRRSTAIGNEPAANGRVECRVSRLE